jgi:hypothetical protein
VNAKAPTGRLCIVLLAFAERFLGLQHPTDRDVLVTLVSIARVEGDFITHYVTPESWPAFITWTRRYGQTLLAIEVRHGLRRDFRRFQLAISSLGGKIQRRERRADQVANYPEVELTWPLCRMLVSCRR